MADKVLCEKSNLVAIADAVRAKNGTEEVYDIAIDVENAHYTYEETDEKMEQEEIEHEMEVE